MPSLVLQTGAHNYSACFTVDHLSHCRFYSLSLQPISTSFYIFVTILATWLPITPIRPLRSKVLTFLMRMPDSIHRSSKKGSVNNFRHLCSTHQLSLVPTIITAPSLSTQSICRQPIPPRAFRIIQLRSSIRPTLWQRIGIWVGRRCTVLQEQLVLGSIPLGKCSLYYARR